MEVASVVIIIFCPFEEVVDYASCDSTATRRVSNSNRSVGKPYTRAELFSHIALINHGAV